MIRKKAIPVYLASVFLTGLLSCFPVQAHETDASAFLPASDRTLIFKTADVPDEAVSYAQATYDTLPDILKTKLQEDNVAIYLISEQTEQLYSDAYGTRTKCVGLSNAGVVTRTYLDDQYTGFYLSAYPYMDIDSDHLLLTKGRTVLHEVGHTVDMDAWIHTGTYARFSDTPEFQDMFARYQQVVGGYSSMSSVNVYNPTEFFAESFLVAESDPMWLAQRCPDLYNYLQNCIIQYCTVNDS